MQVNPNAKQINRVKIAEIIAPLGPVIAFVYSVYDPRGYVSLGWYVFYFVYAAINSYLCFFLLGLPLINFVKRKNYYNLWGCPR